MSIEALAQNTIDQKTKPPGSLGQLERIAMQICLIQKTVKPTLSSPHIVVYAADHGLARKGVSAFPPEVTGQMVLNFANGGAAINVFSRQHDIELTVADVGVHFDFDPDLPIAHLKVAHGTSDMSGGPAMTASQLSECRNKAERLVAEIYGQGSNIIGFGEMGIGNTSSAALIFHLLSQTPLEDCIGRGTGLDDSGLQHKLRTLKDVAQRHGSAQTPDEILLSVGGFEIACMAASMQYAAKRGMIVLVDGFIATAAAMLSIKADASTKLNMLFCHQSEENGHKAMLDYIGADPILDLGLRLGEGTGCALAYPIIESSLAFLRDMASFESASISGKSG